jgi:hypothetical protein
MSEVHTSRVPDEPLDPERAVRLLRAKTAELEQRSLHPGPDVSDIAYIKADLALIASLLADLIERQEARWKWSRDGKS